jgi:hypothetical protein
MAPKIASKLSARRAGRLPFALLGFLWALPLAAQTPSGTDAAEKAESAPQRAQRLFDEARTLMKQERYPEACERLAESQALDPGGGTLLNLGICRLHEGRTATAFRMLSDARDQARAAGRADRTATAEKYLAEVTPRLSRLVLELPPNGLPDGTLLEVDGSPVELSAASEPRWLDPGDHLVRVSRDGFQSYDAKFTLGPDADTQHVTLPELAPVAEPAMPPIAPVPPPAAAEAVREPVAQPAAKAEHSSPPALAYALLAGGGAALVAGSYFGVQAFSHKHASDEHYDGTHCTQSSCVDDWNQAKTSAIASDVAFGVGIAAAGTGLYLLLAHPKPSSHGAASIGLTFGAGRSAGFASASGRF